MLVNKWAYKLGCLNAAFTIIVGAAGGHKETWSQDRKNTFHKAQIYHFMNSLGMIVSSLSVNSPIPLFLFGCGTFLFCCPLYHKAFTDKKTLSGFLPPWGGMGMILAWISLAFL